MCTPNIVPPPVNDTSTQYISINSLMGREKYIKSVNTWSNVFLMENGVFYQILV